MRSIKAFHFISKEICQKKSQKPKHLKPLVVSFHVCKNGDFDNIAMCPANVNICTFTFSHESFPHVKPIFISRVKKQTTPKVWYNI